MSGREEFPDRNRGVSQAGVAPRHESAPTRAHDGSAGGVSTRPSPHEVMRRNGIVIQYGREDIDYESWYSEWMKNLALVLALRGALEIHVLFPEYARGAK